MVDMFFYRDLEESETVAAEEVDGFNATEESTPVPSSWDDASAEPLATTDNWANEAWEADK